MGFFAVQHAGENLKGDADVITEALIKAAWDSTTESVNALARRFKVKPAEVREAFDIALARQPKTTEAELAARRDAQRKRVRKAKSKKQEMRRIYNQRYYEKYKEELLAKKRKNCKYGGENCG